MKRLYKWAFCIGACLASSVHAQDFPNKPVRLIVPYAAAGSFDPLMRAAAAVMQRQLGQPVIVENRTGGDLIVGAQAVLQAPADGHTWFAPGASITTWKIFNRNAPVDAVRDFLPVVQILDVAGAGVIVNSAVPARTFSELIVYAKANPGKLNYGHASRALMLTTEWMKMTAGIDLVPVPYKGGGDVMNAVLGNNVQLVLDNVANYVPHANAGKLRILAVLGKERSAAAADVPTTGEQGLKGLVYSNWLGILVSAQTPRALIPRLNREWTTVIRSKEFEDMNNKVFGGSSRLVPGSPDDLGRLIQEETTRWSEVARAAKIQAE